MAGRCFGLGRLALVFEILIPAALPSILAGLKIGWAFAWRRRTVRRWGMQKF